MQSGSGSITQCGSNSYWDSSTNSCQVSSSCGSYTTTATCTAASGCAWNSTGNYCYSASASNTTPTGTPSAPSGLTAVLAPGTTNVNLSWTDTAPNTETFKVYRRKSGTLSWELLASQTYSLRIYADLSLAFGSYEYYVVACSSAGCSGQSNWAYVSVSSSSKIITGTVTFSDGTPVTDAKVNAWNKSTNKGSEATTASDGSYTLAVSGGTWELYVYPTSANAPWGYNQPPKTVVFAADETTETTTSSFTVVRTDTTIKGKIVKPDGSAPDASKIQVNFQSSGGLWFPGNLATDGSFVAKVTAGTYYVSIYVQDGNLTAPQLSSLSVVSGETKDIGTITLVAATKTITGTIMFSDGRPVTDASVGAFQKSSQQWMDARVDSNGSYAMKVRGGSWEVSLHPTSQTSQWNFGQEPKLATFKGDTALETITLNFTVAATDATITGKVVKPDGTAPSRDTVYVNVEGSEGKNFGGSVDSTGAFRMPVTAGTYRFSVWSQDPKFSASPIPLVTVAQGSLVDVGTTHLVEKVDHIKGTVRDSAGKGLGMIEVNAWMPQGSAYVSTKTDSAGSFDLLVMPGEWEMHVRPDPSTDYYSADPPQRVSVTAGISATAAFTLLVADAGISGTVVDATGVVLPNAYGFINLSQSLMENHTGLGGPIERGTFSFKAPAGTYSLFLFLPPESPYTPREGISVVLQSGETKLITVTVSKNTATIEGTLQDEKGGTVTNVGARVFATSGNGAWQEGRVDLSTGRYAMKVAAGTWYVGYDIDSASHYLSAREPNIKIEVKEGETVTQHLIVKKAGSVVAGRVIDPTGAGVFNAFVGVSKTSFSGALQSGEFKDPIITHTETDAQGAYKLAVPAGSYFIKTFVAPDRGFINSKEVAISIVEGESKTVDLLLRKTDFAITGRVLYDGVSAPAMFVWGWSDKGGYQESFTRIDGSFRLNITGSEKWTIAAAGEMSGLFYKSNEVTVEMGTANVVQNIDLARYQELPKAVVQTAEATKPTVVEVEGGATIVVSANAIATTGSVQIQAAPDARAPSQGEIKVVGVAYNLSARDDAGQEITSFKADVTISLPYTEEDVRSLGARENDLVMSFWDETTATWKTLDRSVVNKEKKIVTASVDHFTRFAIVAAADIMPPQPPIDIRATALATGGVQVTWVNPVTDFHHAKIYRSSTTGFLGSNIAVDVLTNTFSDTKDIAAGTTYHYTVRAVDAAGNESNNISGIAVVATVSTLVSTAQSPIAALPPGQISSAQIDSDLALDSVEPAVTLLQQLLVAEGVYPEARITGYFGLLTQKAVIRFQEKYAAEILAPLGLKAGTGRVGLATRAKMNVILTNGLPPSSAVPLRVGGTLDRNLTVGSRGEDVRTLQRFLNSYGVSITSDGPGSPGDETDYFGALTQTAVIRFQESHADEILYPANLSSGTGFVGPATRTLINRVLRAQ